MHVEGGWTATAASGTPRLAAKFDALSGNRHPTSGTVTGFNPLYPNLSYSTEATIEAATNLIEIGGTLTVTPARRWTVVWTVERLWRQSTADAIYVAPLIPLVLPEVGTHQRAIGNEQQLATTWRIDDRVAVKAALVQFKVGGDLRAVGARDERYVMGWISLRY